MKHSEAVLTLSQKVRDFIEKKPYLKFAIESGIVNYSKAAKYASAELGTTNRNSVKAIMARQASSLLRKRKGLDNGIISLLKKSKFSLTGKVCSIISSKQLEGNPIAMSKTPSGYTYIFHESECNSAHATKGLAIINIKSSPEIQYTPGVAAFLIGNLSENGINVMHFLDCREDTFIVIREDEAPLAFSVLASKIGV